MIVQSSGKNILGQRTVFRRKMIQDLREEARELSLFAKKIRTRRAAANSKRQNERKGWNSPSGPKSNLFLESLLVELDNKLEERTSELS